jgi:hypothetical protein
MYALVIDNTITKYFSYPKGFTLGDLQYPSRHIYEMVCFRKRSYWNL